MYKTIILLLAFDCCMKSSFALNNNIKCKTPHLQDGICINIKQCPFILSQLRFNLPAPKKTYLRKYRCGKTDVVEVCCPKEIQNTMQHTTTNNPLNYHSVERFAPEQLPQPGKCGLQPLSDHIYGGKMTKITEYPWMAMLKYKQISKNNDKYLCGGSLINENYVLTAAHCIHYLHTEGWKLIGVRLGEWNQYTRVDCTIGNICSDPLLDVPIVKNISHENYKGVSNHFQNDIGLIRLARSIQFTNWIVPLCLPISQKIRNRNYDDYVFSIGGFGKTEYKGESAIKLKIDIKNVPLNQCQKMHKNSKNSIQLSENQICAGGKDGIDSCVGDSGNALIAVDDSNPEKYYFYAAGILSFGSRPCGTKNIPAVHTRVDRYIDWILSHMKY